MYLLQVDSASWSDSYCSISMEAGLAIEIDQPAPPFDAGDAWRVRSPRIRVILIQMD